MSKIVPKSITRKYAKRKFNTIGLCLILYCLLVLVSPILIKKYLELVNNPILENETLYVGIYYLILVFGTLIPFFMMRIASDVRVSDFYKKARMSFSQINNEAIVFFLVSSVAIFASTAFANKLDIDSSLLFNIGTVASETHFHNIIYVLMFIVFSPIIEEYAFRGVLLKSLSRFGKVFALWSSTIIFTLAHGSLAEMIPSLVMGYLLGKIALANGSIQPCIIIRILFNGIFYLLSIVPNEYSSYAIWIMLIIYFISIVIIIRNKHQRITIVSTSNTAFVFKLFLSSFSIILAIILLISHSIYSMFI